MNKLIGPSAAGKSTGLRFTALRTRTRDILYKVGGAASVWVWFFGAFFSFLFYSEHDIFLSTLSFDFSCYLGFFLVYVYFFSFFIAASVIPIPFLCFRFCYLCFLPLFPFPIIFDKKNILLAPVCFRFLVISFIFFSSLTVLTALIAEFTSTL